MTRTLILMRHAKSSWDNPDLSDHARPLNQRGTRSAQAMGDWLRRGGTMPDQVVSSSSRRTRETCAELALPLRAVFTDDLYHASAEKMRQVLAAASGQVVLMIGHNPGIGALAAGLLSAGPNHPRFADFPTCATLIARFEIDQWPRIKWETGTVMDFAIPREVMK